MKIAVGGPPGAGKTTVSFFLSELLDMPIFSLDDCRQTLYPQWGYSDDTAESIFRQEGALALHQYESEYELRAMEHALSFEQSLIIDLSGGVLLQKSDDHELRLKRALAEIDLLLLVLPTLTESPKALSILENRVAMRDNGNGVVYQWLAFGGKDFLQQMVKATLECAKRFDTVFIDTEEIIEDTILEILRTHLL